MATTSAYVRVVNAKKTTQPVGVKYSHRREWFGVTTGCSIEPNLWNADTGQAGANCKEAADINAAIARVSSELQTIAAGLTKQGIDPTVAAVREAYKVSKSQQVAEETAAPAEAEPEPIIALSFLYYLDKFIQSKNGGYTYAQIRARSKKLRKEDRTAKIPPTGGVFAYNTMKTFYGLYVNIEEFQKHERRTLMLEDFDKALLTRFQAFLIGQKNYLNASVCKAIKSLKRVLNQLADDDLMPHTKYKRFILSDKKKVTARTVIALSKQELHALWAMDVDNKPGVGYVRDLFVLGCSTGLRYSDLTRLGPSHVRNNEIHIETQKTGEEVTIPLNPISAAILTKYHRRIRKVSIQKYNEHLKTLLQLLPSMREPVERVRWSGAERRSEVVQKWELVTSHTARRTFINVSLESGVSVAVLRGWVGHANLEQLLEYADATRNAASEMGKAFGS
ncbi:tyrosine-type recombinase/integrase [Hymenobacter sp. ASUV-10]|uniref:Tyrosine-type recombinase/integrase n=1 Tax=Hymenobacter aranciens TaxID=3063996 RepID=A0ABT9B7U3_9BACT|nr:tyrosine-type recombinase/integrase [Hymenobacter sp. ASUV-10]MDO7874341.1 tyrosine-type recombinase/integrase [Hymenobacter sp. ASUV-10]